MRLSEHGPFRRELSSHDIRALTARMAHPDDPLAEWRYEFEEWRKAYAEFLEMERERLIPADVPSAILLRQHRLVLFFLMARGEDLALALMQSDDDISQAERNQLLAQIDAFLGSLCDSWHTWHGEALPKHREELAKFFS